jgi:glutathione S-transferase
LIELYHNNMSVCAQKVRIVLAEKRIKVHEHHLNLRAGDSHSPQYLALNPSGVVPTLVVDSRPIIESTVICEYLDEAFSDNPLLPVDPVQRASARWWTMRPDVGLHRACSTLSFAVAFRFQNSTGQMTARKPGAQTRLLTSLIANGLDSPELPPALVIWAQILDAMGARLADHEWLCGEAFSLADIAMLPYIARLSNLRQSWLWSEDPNRSGISDWFTRCQARAGFRGISDYLDDTYLATMQTHGMEAEPRLRDLFKGSNF